MGIPKSNTDSFSFADYQLWNDNQRWEIIEGWAYDMSPAPKRKHQEIAGNLYFMFKNFLNGKTCKVFITPFDICLCEKSVSDEEIQNVVQPDISVFCDSSKLNEKGARGAPDLIVEVLSESTYKKDLGIKLLLYQKYGVKEYWIVDPSENSVTIYKIDEQGRYRLDKEYLKEEQIVVGIFPEMIITVNEVFEE